jgi:uncharacterized protein involved in outer membrane biogenesis
MTLTRRQKKWAIITASVVVVLVLIITFLPMIVRKVAVKQIAAATQRTTIIEDVDINLFTRRIAIKGFQLADKTRPDAFVQFKDLALKFYYLPLFRGHLKLAELNLAAPSIGLARTAANEFNFSDLLAGEKKEKKGGFDVTVERLKLSDGIIVLEDNAIAPARSWKAEGLNFEAADLSTRAAGPAGKATLNLTLAGTPISINASELHLTPTNGQAALKFEGFDLVLLLPYVPSDTPATLQSGRLSVALTLKYGGPDGTHLDGDVGLEKIAVLQQGKQRPFFSAPELKLNLKNINVNNGVFNVAAVELTGDPTVVDTSLAPPSQFDLSKLKVSVQKLTWPQNEPAILQINSQLPKGGSLDVGGTVVLKPVKAELKVRLKDADLSAYQRYIPISAPLAGKAETDLVVVASMDGALQASANGRVSVSRLALGPPKEPLVSIEQASATTIDVKWPAQIKIARVLVRKPSALIERNKDGTLPLREMFSAPGTEASKPDGTTTPAAKKEVAAAPPAKKEAAPTSATKPAAKPQPPKTAIDIGEIVVEEGFARFIDRTAEQPYTEELSRLAINIKGLSNAPGKKGKLTLQSVIGATGALELHGDIAPLGESLWLDLDGELRDFAIPRVNPYTTSLLSWIAKDGRLGTKVHFGLDGDKLDVKSEIVVGRLDLVKASEDDKAKDKIGLPLGLIVALMKDARGEIRVNIPVSGNLGSPEFSLSDAIWTAVKNMIVNILAAPFRAIGRLFTSSDDKIAFSIDPVRFEPGSAAISGPMDEQIKKLGDFLRSSPYVRISLAPVTGAGDIQAFKTQEITARLQRVQRESLFYFTLEMAARGEFRKTFPDRKVPDNLNDIVAAFREVEPRPEQQAQKLAAGRLEVVRERLSAAGTDAKRLETAPKNPPPDTQGDGRIEFSIVP